MQSSRTVWLISIGLAALSVLAFAPALDNGFVNLDDDTYIARNPHVLGGLTPDNVAWAFGTSFHAGNWHPLTWMSLQADATLFGTSPDGFHRTSVALHACNAVLLFLAFARLTGRIVPSAVVAALFAVHPLRVESVAWVSERKDVLSSLFGIAAIYAYAGGRERMSVARLCVVAAAYVLSLLAKPMLVTLPFLLLLLDWWPLRRIGARDGESDIEGIQSRLLLEKLPLIALAVATCIVTWYAQRTTAISSLELVPIGTRLANVVVTYAAYLKQTVYPFGLIPFYPLRTGELNTLTVVTSVAVLVALSVIALLQVRSRPWLLVGWLWYLGLLVPVLGLVQVGQQARADRYTYLPGVGLLVILVWTVDEFATRFRLQRFALLMATLAVYALLILSRSQSALWHDDFTLWQYTLRVSPDNWIAHYGLGTAEEKAGQIQKAIDDYREAIRLNPSFAPIRGRLGTVLHGLGQYSEARRCYEDALILDPKYAQIHGNFGALLRTLGDPQEALTHLSEAVKLAPDDPESAVVYFNLGAVLEADGDRPGAVSAYENATRLDPSNLRYRQRLEALQRATH